MGPPTSTAGTSSTGRPSSTSGGTTRSSTSGGLSSGEASGGASTGAAPSSGGVSTGGTTGGTSATVSGSSSSGSNTAGSSSGGPGPYIVTLTRTGGGTVTDATGAIFCGDGFQGAVPGGGPPGCGAFCNNLCSASFPSGTQVALTATPDSSSTFAGFNGDCLGAACSFSISRDMNIAATFGSCTGQVFAQQIGGSGDQQLLAAAVDPASGNMYVGGLFEDNINIQGTVLTSAGQGDGLVEKLSPTGDLLWAVSFGGPLDDEVYGLAVFPNGDVAVGGRFMPGATFAGTALPNAGFSDVIVARLAAATGQVVWLQTFGGPYHDIAYSVSVGPTGDLLVAGGFNDTIAFGSTTLVSAGDFDVFVARLEGNTGSVIWASRGGGSHTDYARSVTVDSAGDAVATGFNFSTDGTFSNNPDATDGDNIFLAKYVGADGGMVWGNGYGQIESMGFSVRAAGTDLLLAAAVGTYADFGNGQVVQAPEAESAVALVSFDALGTAQWSEVFGGGPPVGSSWSYGMDLAADGTIWLAGAFSGLAALAPVPGTSLLQVNSDSQGWALDDAGTPMLQAGWPWPRDAFVGHYTATGDPIWTRHFGGHGQDLAAAIAALPDGGAIAVGSFSQRIDLCTSVMTSDGGLDAFVLRLSDPSDGGLGALTLLSPAAAGQPPADAGPSLCIPPGPPAAGGPVNPAPTFTQGPAFDVNFSVAGGGVLFPDGGQGLLAADSTQFGGALYLYATDGGVFYDVTATAMPTPIAVDQNVAGLLVDDFNGDGLTDAFVANFGYDDGYGPGAPNELVLQNAPGRFVRAFDAVPRYPWALHSFESGVTSGAATADIDCDGDLDVFVSLDEFIDNPDTGPGPLDQFLVNDGIGNLHSDYSRAPLFVQNIGYSTGAVTFCDVNRDGAPDLILGAVPTPGSSLPQPHLWVLLNDGYGNFALSPSLQLPPTASISGIPITTEFVSCVDYDQDGWPDLIYTGCVPSLGQCQAQLAHNNHDGTWTDVTSTALPDADDPLANGFVVTDLNNDGWPDVAIAAQPHGTPRIWINQGGTFIDIGSSLATSAAFGQMLAMDVNRDGKMDLVWLGGTQIGSVVLFNNGW